MSRFSRLSKTVDYSSFDVTRDPGVFSLEALDAFAQVDPDAHPLIDEYRIERVIDRSGSQADVYLAKRRGRQFALKLYHRDFSPSPEVQRRLASGECPYIAPILASGRYKGDYWYEVFPYYSSGSLDDVIARAGKCTPQFVEERLVPAIDGALHYLHSHHLVHADVKPQNIFVSDDGQDVVLGDFGVAGLIRNSDGFVPFRGTLEYAPNVLHSGNLVKIDASYDYGALGLVLIKAYTGRSPLAGMSLDERDRAILSIRVPESIPPNARILIQGLLRRDERTRFGHNECLEFSTAKKLKRSYASRRGKGRYASAESESRQKSFEFGLFDGQMIIVNSLASLLEACETYWSGAKASIGTGKLETFLRRITGSDEFHDRYVVQFRCKPIDERVFRLCFALRLEEYGPQDHSITYKGKSFRNVVGLFRHLDSHPDSELADILEGESIPDYLRAYQYGEDVACAVEDVLKLSQPMSAKAGMLISLCDDGAHPLYVGGKAVESVDDLLLAMIDLSMEEIAEVTVNASLKPWLHKHNCDFVIDEMEECDEQ